MEERLIFKFYETTIDEKIQSIWVLKSLMHFPLNMLYLMIVAKGRNCRLRDLPSSLFSKLLHLHCGT